MSYDDWLKENQDELIESFIQDNKTFDRLYEEFIELQYKEFLESFLLDNKEFDRLCEEAYDDENR